MYKKTSSFWPELQSQNCFWRFQPHKMLDIVPSCNLVQYYGKLKMQPSENGKNIWGPPDFFMGYTSS